MEPGDEIEFRAIGPHGWHGKGTIHSVHNIFTVDYRTVPVFLVLLTPGEAWDREGQAAKEGQGIVLGAGEIL